MSKYTTRDVIDTLTILHTTAAQWKGEALETTKENKRLKKEIGILKSDRPLQKIEDKNLTETMNRIVDSLKYWRMDNIINEDDETRSATSSKKKKRCY